MQISIIMLSQTGGHGDTHVPSGACFRWHQWDDLDKLGERVVRRVEGRRRPRNSPQPVIAMPAGVADRAGGHALDLDGEELLP